VVGMGLAQSVLMDQMNTAGAAHVFSSPTPPENNGPSVVFARPPESFASAIMAKVDHAIGFKEEAAAAAGAGPQPNTPTIPLLARVEDPSFDALLERTARQLEESVAALAKQMPSEQGGPQGEELVRTLLGFCVALRGCTYGIQSTRVEKGHRWV
jgi:hypothetical protein